MPLGRVYIPPPTTPLKYGSEFSFSEPIHGNNKFNNKFSHTDDRNEEDDFLIQNNNLKNKLNDSASKQLNFNYNVDINGVSEEEKTLSKKPEKAFRKIEIKILNTKYSDDEEEKAPNHTDICNGNVGGDDEEVETDSTAIKAISTSLDTKTADDRLDEACNNDKMATLTFNGFNNTNEEFQLDSQDRITEVEADVDNENDCDIKTNGIIQRGMNNHQTEEENCQALNLAHQNKSLGAAIKHSNHALFPSNTKGLKNLGNTCYMNSIIQCLANTRPLLEFCVSFLESQHNLTTTSPNKMALSTSKGKALTAQEKITKAFVSLLEDMWNLKNKSTMSSNNGSRSNHGIADPSNFRLCITKFAPKFSGFDQHDSQEFLQYALEGFHTELNRAKKMDKKDINEKSAVLEEKSINNNQILVNGSAVDSNCDSVTEVNDINNNENPCTDENISCDTSNKEEGKFQNIKTRTYEEILDDKNLTGEEKGRQCLAVYLSKDDSFITDLFLGQFRSTLQCCVCNHQSITFEPFWLISVPIPSSKDWKNEVKRTVIDCLQEFTKIEILDGDEKPTCENCKERMKCKKWYSVERWPRILVIHLKRFAPSGSYRPKISCVVDVTLKNLDFSMFSSSNRQRNGLMECNEDLADNENDPDEELDDSADENNEDNDNTMNGDINENIGISSGNVLYDCYAISNHSGTLSGGHYTAYCHHPFNEDLGNKDDDLESWNNSWHLYNDRAVSKTNGDNVISGDAYLLFFEKH